MESEKDNALSQPLAVALEMESILNNLNKKVFSIIGIKEMLQSVNILSFLLVFLYDLVDQMSKVL